MQSGNLGSLAGEFCKRCTVLVETCGDLPEKEEGDTRMRAWAEENDAVTDAMETALTNMENGVARWSR